MASSSADICAVLAAVGFASGRPLTERAIGRLAASIEPTDGIFCRGMAVIEPDTGTVKAVLGPVPKLSIAVFDAGGTVDTVAFHEKGRRRRNPDSKAIAAGMTLLQSPLTAENLGRAATYSALANQVLLEKPDFPAFVEGAFKSLASSGSIRLTAGPLPVSLLRKGRALTSGGTSSVP